MAIVTAGEKGRNAFVGNRGIHYLCETVIRNDILPSGIYEFLLATNFMLLNY